jgi:hypothetical protein
MSVFTYHYTEALQGGAIVRAKRNYPGELDGSSARRYLRQPRYTRGSSIPSTRSSQISIV